MKTKKERKTRIFFDMHLPEWEKAGVAQNFNVKDIASALIAADADSVILYAKCQYGNAYYDTEIGHKHAGLGSLDLLRELTDKLHAVDKEVIAYYSVAWDEFQAARHPEWMTVKKQGNIYSEEFRWNTLCINSPYRSFVLSQLREIAEQIDVDGFWIDMTIIGEGRCYCDYCREKFRKSWSNGHEHSNVLDDFAPTDRTFLDFRFDYIEEFFKDVYAALRGSRKELQILNNYWGYPYSPLSMGSRAIGAQTEADMVTGEAYTDWTGLQAPEFFSRFLRSVAKDRHFEALISRFVNTWDFTRKPYDQMFFECMTVFSHGGMVTLDDEPYYDGSIDKQLYHVDLRSIFQSIHKYAYALEGKRQRYAAVYHSQYTKNVCKQTDFIKDVVGAYKLFRDSHIPVDFVFDEDSHSENLAPYQVIFMPSVSHLEEHAKKALLDYVDQGGLLISCGINALAVEFVELGLVSEGESDYSLSYIRTCDDANPMYLLVRGRYERYRLDNANSSHNANALKFPYLVDPIVENNTKLFYHNNLPSPYKDSDYPLAVQLSIGKGSVILFNQPLARSYAKQPSKGLRKILLDIIFSIRFHPFTMMQAPFRVASEVYDNIVLKKLYVHLMVAGNDSSLSCGILDTMQGNFERPYVYMEERDRASNIKIELHLDKQVKTIASIYEKNQLLWEQKGKYVTVDIDGVSLWDIIEVNYEEYETDEDYH